MPWPSQNLRNYALNVTPVPQYINTDDGAYVVNISRLTIIEPLAELVIDSSFDVEVYPPHVLTDTPSPSVSDIRQMARAELDMSKFSPAAYLFASTMTPMETEISQWARGYFPPDMGIVQAALAFAQLIRREFKYDSKATENDTPVLEAFKLRRGVCQDFAHIMSIALRANGLPAAYVSGYLRTLPPLGKPKLVGADATHAWVNVWCGSLLGWVGFDPTNGCLAATDHIFTAMGRDYADVSPVNGVLLGGAGQHLRVSVDVNELPS